LQMTRLESGGIAIERDLTALDELAGSVLRRLAEPLAAHRVVVELPGDLPLLHVSATLIEQALGNLLENAATHTPAGTVVRLRAWQVPGNVIVSVEDTGTGLDEAEAERVFAKFQHGTTRSLASGAGIGLGLSICRAIVELHGGRAWGERLPEGGSAFRLMLPVAPVPVDVPVEPRNG
jgi:two-component system sensor histidine kinase KdpD